MFTPLRKRLLATGVLAAATAAALTVGLGTASGSADANSPYVIGILQGPPAQGGPIFLQGMQIAAKELNAKGGIGGHPVSIKVYNTDGKLESVTAAYRAAANNKALLGVFNGSSGGLAVRALAQTLKVPAITASGNDKVDFPVSRYVFANAATGDYATAPLLHAVQVYGAKKIAVLHYTDVDFSVQIAPALRKRCPALGCEIVDEESISVGASNAELIPLLTKMKGSGADVYAIEELNPNALKAAKDLGMFDHKIIGFNWLAVTSTAQATGTAGEGVWFASQKCRLTNLNQLLPKDPMKQYCLNYQKGWNSLFPGTPLQGFSVYGYDAVRTFAAAAAKVAKANKSLTRETLTDAMGQFTGKELLTAVGYPKSSAKSHRLTGPFEQGFVGMMMKLDAKGNPIYYIPANTPRAGSKP